MPMDDFQRYPQAPANQEPQVQNTNPYTNRPGGNKFPFEQWQFSGGPYTPGPQPQTTPRGGTPAYYVPPNQLNPLQTRPINSMQDFLTNRKEIYKQLIPTSVNVRNMQLQNLLRQIDVPMEQLYAAQGVDQMAGQRSQQMDAIRAGLTGRGIFNSGLADEAELSTEMQYLRGVAGAQMGAKGQEDERQNQLIQQLLSVPEADLRFYQAIRGGTIPAGNLWSAHPQEWGMAAHGIGTAVRSAAMAAAGGAAGGGGGMGMGAGGFMGGGEGGFDMSSFGGGGGGYGQYLKTEPYNPGLYGGGQY